MMETKKQDKDGNTALMLACSKLNVEVVQLLANEEGRITDVNG